MWTKEPTFKVLPHSDGWEVATEGVYSRKDRHARRQIIRVPTGFRTDFASIPRAARWLIPVNGKHRLPALLHDRNYRLDLPEYLNEEVIDRKDADDLFLFMMKEAGVGRVKRYAMYYAVRAFGSLHYGGGS